MSALSLLAATAPASVAPVTDGGVDTDNQDVGTAGPLGLLFVVVLLIAVCLLVRSMSKHLKRLPASFDPADRVPDTPAELIDPPARDPGEELLDVLRRAPRAIEPPRPQVPPS